MTTAVFVDSTTLLYTQDRRQPIKQSSATQWLKTLLHSDRMTVSLQVLNETYSVVRRKPEFAHWRPDIRPFLQQMMLWTCAPPTAALLTEAWRIEDANRIGFWDALLLASANDAGCGYFLSEDLNDGQLYGAVRVINPFRHTPADVLGAAASP
jgi:predicted nucleic acid-binding protein